MKVPLAALVAVVLSSITPAFAAQGEPVLVAQAKTELIGICRAKAEELMTLKGGRRGQSSVHHQGPALCAQGRVGSEEDRPESVYNDIKDTIIARQ